MNQLSLNIHNAIRRLPDLPKRVAVTAADEFDKNWRRQAFFTQAWKPSKRQERDGGSTLLKSGDLRRSLRYNVQGWRILFYSDRKDAAIHNEGGTVRPRVTAKMRKFAWAKHKETGQSKWKALALTQKNQLNIHIPQRQFAGHHPMLDIEVDRTVHQFLNKIL